MVAVLSALAVAVALPTLASAISNGSPLSRRSAITVLTDVQTWTSYLDDSCVANSTCLSELGGINTCGQDYLTAIGLSGTPSMAQLNTTEHCLCNAPAPTCIACEAALQSASPQANFTLLATAYNDLVQSCVADGFAYIAGTVVVGTGGVAASTVSGSGGVASAAPTTVRVASVGSSISVAPAASPSSSASSVVAVSSSAAASASKAASAGNVARNGVLGLGLGLAALALLVVL